MLAGSSKYVPLDTEKSMEHDIELRNSYYSEKVDHRGGTYLHPLLSANRSQLMGLFAGIAFIILIVSTVLTWILYARQNRGILLWLGISMIAITLASVVVAVIGFLTKRHILNEVPESKILSAIAYLCSGLSAAFLLMSVLVLLVFRWPRFNQLVLSTGQESRPKGNYPDNFTFEEAWKSDKAMIWWTAFFNLLAGLLLVSCSFLMWSISKYMIELGRGILSMAAGLAVTFFVLSLFKVLEGTGKYMGHGSI